MQQDERRRYFRINDVLIVRITPLAAEEYEVTKQAMIAGAPWPIQVGPPLASADSGILDAIEALRRKAPLTHKALGLLHQKLQAVSAGNQAAALPWAGLCSEVVNVSATGMAVFRDPPYPVGQLVILEWVLFPEQHNLHALGRVVAHRTEGRFNMAMDFTFLLAAHKERLIRHILRKQASAMTQERQETTEMV